MLDRLDKLVDQYTQIIVRPYRSKYDEKQIIQIIGSEFEGHRIQKETIIDSYSDEINGTMVFSKQENDTCVIFCHGNGQNQTSVMMISEDVIAHGYNLFAFDMPGCGRSKKEFITFGYSEPQTVFDISTHLQKQYGFRKIILWGYSFGAHVCLSAASQFSGFSAVIADSPYTSIKAFIAQFCQDSLKSLGVSFETFYERVRQNIIQNYRYDIDPVDLIPKVQNIQIPVIMIHGQKDTTCNVQMGHEIFEKIGTDQKNIIIVPKMVHNHYLPQDITNQVFSQLSGFGFSLNDC